MVLTPEEKEELDRSYVHTGPDMTHTKRIKLPRKPR